MLNWVLLTLKTTENTTKTAKDKFHLSLSSGLLSAGEPPLVCPRADMELGHVTTVSAFLSGLTNS